MSDQPTPLKTPAGAILTTLGDARKIGHGPPPPRPKLTIEYRELTANHPGHCPECDLPIHVGQTIRLWSDQRWRHISCTPAGAQP